MTTTNSIATPIEEAMEEILITHNAYEAVAAVMEMIIAVQRRNSIWFSFEVLCRINGFIWRLVSLMSAEREPKGSFILSSCFMIGDLICNLAPSHRPVCQSSQLNTDTKTVRWTR